MEKEDAFKFLEEKLSYIESILKFEHDLDTVKHILCVVFAEEYCKKYSHTYIFSNITTDEFSQFLTVNIKGLRFKTETKTTYTAKFDL